MLQNDVLLRKGRNKCTSDVDLRLNKIVVPKSLREKLLFLAHDVSGHLGLKKTLDRLQRNCWWPGISRNVKNYRYTAVKLPPVDPPNSVIRQNCTERI